MLCPHRGRVGPCAQPGFKIFFQGHGHTGTDSSRFETLDDSASSSLADTTASTGPPPLSPSTRTNGREHIVEDAPVTESPKTAKHLSNLYARPTHFQPEPPVWKK
jgi:hypothetical protein